MDEKINHARLQTLHIVTHTHWDREWYLTFQQFRLKLVHLVDGLLELLASDPHFHNFMLDGQTIILDDYLQVRPEREAELRGHIQAGRISIGPWHILPDEFLVSPEATIRNLLQGRRSGRRYGPLMQVGYSPDPFGHIGQMPQILAGFGIGSAAVQRGLADEPCEFWWQAPDGTRVFMAYLRDGYGNAAELPAGDPLRFAGEVRRLRYALAPHSESRQLLLMWGTDHSEPSPLTSSVIAAASERLKGDHLQHSSLPEYLQAVQAELQGVKLPVLEGELRQCKRHPLLPNVLSSRMWIKQRNVACENLLEKWAEPFSSFARLAWGGKLPPAAVSNPAPLLRQAWRLLMENHPHDSICGTSIDPVHIEMGPRFDQAEQIGEAITAQSLEALASQIHTLAEGMAAAITVFNPTGGPRTDWVRVDLQLPPQAGDFEILGEDGQGLPHQKLGLGSRELIHTTLGASEFQRLSSSVSDGRISNFVVTGFSARRAGSQVTIEITLNDHGSPDRMAWEEGMRQVAAFLADPGIHTYTVLGRSVATTRLDFLARDVPGCGWRTFWVRPVSGTVKPAQRLNPWLGRILPLAARLALNPQVQRLAAPLAQAADPHFKPPFRIENEFLAVEAAMDGTLNLLDKSRRVRYDGLNCFWDGGDRGDEYNYAPVPGERLVQARRKRLRVERGPLQQTLDVWLELRIPQALATDRKSRTMERVSLPIHTHITLTAGVPRLEIHTEIENRAGDHRLRVHFPLPFAATEAWQDGHFEIIRRPVGVPPADSSWIEQPSPEVPQRAFTQVSDGQHDLTLAVRGLPEVEILRRPAGQGEIALTLLRCVGWLSRDDFPERSGHAGPAVETPGAQLLGTWSFDYALIPQAASAHLEAFKQAYAFNTPLRGLGMDLHDGPLAASGAFLAIEPAEFMLSSVKESEDGASWVARGYNLGGELIIAHLKPLFSFLHAWKANLAEEPNAVLEADVRGGVSLAVRGHEIVTLRFEALEKP